MKRLLCFLLGHRRVRDDLRWENSEAERAARFDHYRTLFRSWRPEGYCVRCGQREGH